MFIFFVPLWAIVYFITSWIMLQDFCYKTWPHDYVKNHCIHHTRRVLRILELNPVIRVFTYNRLLKTNVLPQKYVNQVYEILAFLDYTFTKHNVSWSIDFGTELGSIRHGGFIPWDDDVDIVVLDDIKKVQNAILQEVKLNEKQDYFIFNELHEEGQKWSTIRIKDGIVVDLFHKYMKCYNKHYKKEKYTYSYNNKCTDAIFGSFAWEEEDIWPLKRCKFGELMLPCHNKVDNTYNDYYGKDWMTVAYVANHTFNKQRTKILKNNPDTFKPALPNDDAWKYWVDKKEEWLKNHKK